MSVLNAGKRFSRTRGADQSALCYMQWNPRVNVNAAGAAVTAATMEVEANLIDLQVNGAAEVAYGTYTGNSGADQEITFVDGNANSVGELIDLINGLGVGQPAGLRRWMAKLGDFRRNFAIGNGDGLVTAAANALLGYHNLGLPVLADSSALALVGVQTVGIGPIGTEFGRSPQIPEHFESDYSSTTAGVITPVRAQGRRQEEEPSGAKFRALIDRVYVGLIFATTKVLTIYDEAGIALEVFNLAPTVVNDLSDIINPQNPIEGRAGQMMFAEVTGTGGITAGNVTVGGEINRT